MEFIIPKLNLLPVGLILPVKIRFSLASREYMFHNSDNRFILGVSAFEYCGQIEPAVRSFEPLFTDNRASEGG